MEKSIVKKLMPEIKEDNNGISHKDALAKAREAATKIVDKSLELSKELPTPIINAAIKANASTEAKPVDKDMPIIEVSKSVQDLNARYMTDPSNANAQAVINAETAHGYRNANGEMIVKLTRPKVLGSSAASQTVNTSQFEEIYVDTDGNMNKSAAINTEFIRLDKENNEDNFDKAHSDYLTAALSRITSSINKFQEMDIKIAKATFKAEAQGRYYTDDKSVFVAIDDNGPGAPFRTQFSMGNQEVYTHELTHAALSFIMDPANISVGKDTDVYIMVKTLEDLYKQAKESSTWETLLPGMDKGVQYTTKEIQQAKDKWKYVFAAEDEATGIQEFAAGLLTNKMFKEGMESVKTVKMKEAVEGESAIDTLHRLFKNIIAKLIGLATGKGGRSVTAEGTRLIFDIMRANSNAQSKAANRKPIEAISNAFEKLQDKVDVANETVKKFTDPILKVADTLDEATKGGKLDADGIQEFVKLKKKLEKILGKMNTKERRGNLNNLIFGTVDAIHSITRLVLALPTFYKMRKMAAGSKASKNVAKHLALTTGKLLESVGLMRDGFVRSSLRDFMDRPGMYNYLADSLLKLTHAVDGMRQASYEGVITDLKDAYGEVRINNDRLNAANSEALTDVILRTDIQSLGLDSKGLQELLRDPQGVLDNIAKLSKELSPSQLEDVNSLAMYMVTGVGTPSNADNIARGFGGTTISKASVETIDKLTTYIALELTDKAQKEKLLDFLDGKDFIDYSNTWQSHIRKAVKSSKKPLSEEEYISSVEEGTNMFLNRATGMQAASAEEMVNNRHNIIKGYMKETYNTNEVLEFHPMRDKAELIRQGYKFIKRVEKVPGSTIEFGMFISNAPEVRRANGTLGLQDRKSRGYALSDMINDESAMSTEAWDSSKRRSEFNATLGAIITKYKADKTSVSMSPVFDGYGAIVDFRATLNHADKKKYLDMETSGVQNLARSYSGMGTATVTASHNEEIIDALHADYIKNYNSDKQAYVPIGAATLKGSDYGLDKKDDLVSNSEYEQLWARLPKATKEYAEEKFKGSRIIIKQELLQITFGEDDFSIAQSSKLNKVPAKAKAYIRKIEGIWQDTMQIAKGNIVIKTPEVLLGNLWSNFKILMYVGVHPVKGAKLMLLGARELKKYESDKHELGILLRDKQGGKKNTEKREKELNESIKSNSVFPLIDAGLYQSIVEDVDTSNDTNRVSVWFADKGDKYVSNDTVNGVMQQLFMTKKTSAYKAMLKATQTSDFYSRYAQYYDAIDSKGHSKEKALRDTIDNYINYESPLNKYIRYGDSMGTWFFVKYFVRIQKVIKKIATDHPLRMGMDIALQQFVTGDTADIQDGSILDKQLSTYNPFKIFERLWEVVVPSGGDLVVNLVR